MRQRLSQSQREPIELRSQVGVEHADVRLDAQAAACARGVGYDSHRLERDAQ
jgi:hypothetical protein